MAGTSLKAALLVNIAIAIIKFIVGIISNSKAMIAEGYHSAADSFNQLLLTFGIRRSHKEPDVTHQFGYKKSQFFWSFVVAVLIFGISGTIAFLEGFEIILHPESHHVNHDHFFWTILVLGVAIILEGYAFKTAYNEAKKYKEETKCDSIIEALGDKQDPVLLSLLTEDTLALVGLVVALCGVSLTHVTELSRLDGLTSLIIGLILMTGGLLLAYYNQTYLIGRSINPKTQKKIKDIVNSNSNVKNIQEMKTMMLGPHDLILALDILFKQEARSDIASITDEIEEDLIKEIPMLKKNKIFIEAQTL